MATQQVFRGSQTIIPDPIINGYLAVTPMALPAIKEIADKYLPPGRKNIPIPYKSILVVFMAISIARTTGDSGLREQIIEALSAYSMPPFIKESSKSFSFGGNFDKGEVTMRVRWTTSDQQTFLADYVNTGNLQRACRLIFDYCRDVQAHVVRYDDISKLIHDSSSVPLIGYLEYSGLADQMTGSQDQYSYLDYIKQDQTVVTTYPGPTLDGSLMQTEDRPLLEDSISNSVSTLPSISVAGDDVELDWSLCQLNWRGIRWITQTKGVNLNYSGAQFMFFGPFVNVNESLYFDLAIKSYYKNTDIVISEILLWSQKFVDNNLIVNSNITKQDAPNFEPGQRDTLSRVDVDTIGQGDRHPVKASGKPRGKLSGSATQPTNSNSGTLNARVGRKGNNYVTFNYMKTFQNNLFKKLGLAPRKPDAPPSS